MIHLLAPEGRIACTFLLSRGETPGHPPGRTPRNGGTTAPLATAADPGIVGDPWYKNLPAYDRGKQVAPVGWTFLSLYFGRTRMSNRRPSCRRNTGDRAEAARV